MKRFSNVQGALRRFHENEQGLEALQVVMILAVAAVALIAVKTQWNNISSWFKSVMGEGTGKDNWKQPK